MPETRAGRKATVSCPFCGTLNRVDLSRLADRPKCGKCGRPILLDRPVRVSGEALDRVVQGTDVPVLVDFYADWCGPCKIMAPILDDVARERSGEVLVVKLNTDEAPATTERFGIQGIPTLISFTGGRESGRQVGTVGRAEVDSLLRGATER